MSLSPLTINTQTIHVIVKDRRLSSMTSVTQIDGLLSYAASDSDEREHRERERERTPTCMIMREQVVHLLHFDANLSSF